MFIHAPYVYIWWVTSRRGTELYKLCNIFWIDCNRCVYTFYASAFFTRFFFDDVAVFFFIRCCCCLVCTASPSLMPPLLNFLLISTACLENRVAFWKQVGPHCCGCQRPFSDAEFLYKASILLYAVRDNLIKIVVTSRIQKYSRVLKT